MSIWDRIAGKNQLGTGASPNLASKRKDKRKNLG